MITWSDPNMGLPEHGCISTKSRVQIWEDEGKYHGYSDYHALRYRNTMWRNAKPCLGWHDGGANKANDGYKANIPETTSLSDKDQGAGEWEIVKKDVVDGKQYFQLKVKDTICWQAGCGDDIQGQCLRSPAGSAAEGLGNHRGDGAVTAPCEDTDDFLWYAPNWNLNN
jgi:hypothetical protein